MMQALLHACRDSRRRSSVEVDGHRITGPVMGDMSLIVVVVVAAAE